MFGNALTHNCSLEATVSELNFGTRKPSANDRLFALSKTQNAKRQKLYEQYYGGDNSRNGANSVSAIKAFRSVSPI